MYLTPDVRGRGVGTSTIRAIENFAETQLDNFSKLRVRIAEPNAPSRGIAEKAGFVPVEVLEDDYELVINGEPRKFRTIVYEYGNNVANNRINLAEYGILTGDNLYNTYNAMKNLKA